MVGHCSAVARVFSFVSFPKSSRLFLRTTQHAFQLVENFPLPSSYSSSSSSTSSSSSFSSSSSTRNRKQVFFSGASLIFSIRPNLFGSMKCAKIRCNFFKNSYSALPPPFLFFSCRIWTNFIDFYPEFNQILEVLPSVRYGYARKDRVHPTQLYGCIKIGHLALIFSHISKCWRVSNSTTFCHRYSRFTEFYRKLTGT